jgi:hypothetical protein
VTDPPNLKARRRSDAAVVRSPCSEIVVGEARLAHDGPLSSGAEIPVAVDGDRDEPRSVGMPVDVMRNAAVVEGPAPRFQ